MIEYITQIRLKTITGKNKIAQIVKNVGTKFATLRTNTVALAAA